ncbi:integrase core domain-containing protein [Saccharothrix sp. ALI-22-I]|uniref:integrase core domain-containing protein n=1 Tax=Saccharothrix sp. ALI-22-I TaxID=1933778 RepID=UPI001930EFC0|nr:integrase core domain-containing protein [Saccharothrix sp. ALI-22-I]
MGHRRIQGGRPGSATGSPPRPSGGSSTRQASTRRRAAPARREFSTAQAQGIVAANFLHLDTVLGTRLYALAFLEHDTRRLHITGVTAHPTRDWTAQQAGNLAADLGTRIESPRFLLRDRDGKYGQALDAVFQTEELRAINSASQAPRMNTHCKRIVGSIRREVLDHILIAGAVHARQVLTTYEGHYNRHRPHHARDQLPKAREHPTTVHDLDTTDCYAPASWADSSTTTDTPLEQQR